MKEYPKYTGLKDKEGKLVCEKCETTEGRLIAHMDGKDFFISCFECVKCGNSLSVTHKRSKESMMYWEDDER